MFAGRQKPPCLRVSVSHTFGYSTSPVLALYLPRTISNVSWT